jgi:hypothetical protein
MKIQLIAVTTVLAAALSVSYCKKADDPHAGHMMDTDTTKSVMLGDVQAVFDLMDRAHHEGMMTQMGGKHGGAEKFSHYVLLTMMKKAERKLIMDAEVTFSLTGPDGKGVEKKAHVMTGMGMHHYAAGFDMGAKGDYKVSAAIRQGGKETNAGTVFTVK